MKINLKLNLEFSGLNYCSHCGAITEDHSKCDKCGQYQSGDDDDMAPGFSTGW